MMGDEELRENFDLALMHHHEKNLSLPQDVDRTAPWTSHENGKRVILQANALILIL